MVSTLLFLKSLQTSFPFSFCLAHCSLGASSRKRRYLHPTLLTATVCQLLFQRFRWPAIRVGLHMGQVWLGMSSACCVSPRALDTSLIRLPHTIVQTLAQTPGQRPGLGHKLFVKDIQSHACPCSVEVSCLLPSREQWHTNHPSISSSSNNSVCSNFSYVFFEMFEVSEVPTPMELSAS